MATANVRSETLRVALGALILLWAGVLIGVSFLAAPAKFAAASLSLPVAMDVGRQEFGILDLVEIAFAALTLALATLLRPQPAIWLGIALAALIVAAQALWLLPVLDTRAALIIRGGTPPPAPWHTIYVVAEVLKLLILLMTGWLALQPRRARI